jgi:hypothetical protein
MVYWQLLALEEIRYNQVLDRDEAWKLAIRGEATEWENRCGRGDGRRKDWKGHE